MAFGLNVGTTSDLKRAVATSAAREARVPTSLRKHVAASLYDDDVIDTADWLPVRFRRVVGRFNQLRPSDIEIVQVWLAPQTGACLGAHGVC